MSIDAQGMMKITHMVSLQHIMDQESYLGPSAYSESQASIAGTHLFWDRHVCLQGHMSHKATQVLSLMLLHVFASVQGMCVCEQSSWMQVDISRTGIVSFMMVAEDIDADDNAD